VLRAGRLEARPIQEYHAKLLSDPPGERAP